MPSSPISKRALKQRIAIIAATVTVVICCVAVIVNKQDKREATRQTEYAEQQRMERENAYRLAEAPRLQPALSPGSQDSIVASPGPEHNRSWNDVEQMVRNLTDEDYYASIWSEEEGTPRWVVIYSKGGKRYFRHFDAEKKTYGATVRLLSDNSGDYHASGNKRDRYIRLGNQLIHEVNGVEKERFSNRHTIDLFTPDPESDYEDWEDDEEEDHFYYGLDGNGNKNRDDADDGAHNGDTPRAPGLIFRFRLIE